MFARSLAPAPYQHHQNPYSQELIGETCTGKKTPESQGHKQKKKEKQGPLRDPHCYPLKGLYVLQYGP